MRKVIVDTNILVSALWSEQSNPYRIVEMFLSNGITLMFNLEIMEEYCEVLQREHLGFPITKVLGLLREIAKNGILADSVKSGILFTDEDDRKFYDLAKENEALLITGNQKHYPDEPFILTPTDILQLYTL